MAENKLRLDENGSIKISNVAAKGVAATLDIFIEPFSSYLNLFCGIFNLGFLSFVARNSPQVQRVFFYTWEA